jgi:hypothetical protein
MFTKDFDNYVVAGECITCEVDGFHCVARAHYDEDTKAENDLPLEVFSAWANDEWFYVGIVVTVHKAGIQLTGDYDHALWGIDCNFPSDKANPNLYLREVANDLLPDALHGAKEKIKELCKQVVDFSV